MTLNTITFIAVAAILTGCAQTRYVNPIDASDPSFLEINQKARGAKAELKLDGRTLSVRSIQVTPDSTSWIDIQTGEIKSAATDQVELVSFLKRDRASATLGLLAGGAIGGVLGGLLGYQRGDDECPRTGRPNGGSWGDWDFTINWCTEVTARGKAVAVGALGGLAGGALGGALAMRRYTYKFAVPSRVIRPVIASTHGVVQQRE